MEIESRSKLKFKNGLYKIALLSFLVVVIWIAAEIRWSYTHNQSESDVGSIDLSPVSSNLYLDLASSLSQRESVSEEELERFKATINSTPTISESSSEETLDQPPVDFSDSEVSDEEFLEFIDGSESAELSL